MLTFVWIGFYTTNLIEVKYSLFPIIPIPFLLTNLPSLADSHRHGLLRPAHPRSWQWHYISLCSNLSVGNTLAVMGGLNNLKVSSRSSALHLVANIIPISNEDIIYIFHCLIHIIRSQLITLSRMLCRSCRTLSPVVCSPS